MDRDGDGRLLITMAEAKVVRAALFAAMHHLDEVAGHCDDCFQTITGVDREALAPVLYELDEFNGHNARVDQHLLGELRRLSSYDDAALTAISHLSDLLRAARSRGLEVPVRFEGLE